MVKNNPNRSPGDYFLDLSNPIQRQYLALRRFFVDGHSAEQVALEFGYAVPTVYSLVRDFKAKLTSTEDPFFKESKRGRPKLDHEGEITALVVAHRKKYRSVPEIKAALDAQGITVSERYITSLLEQEGFARLPRREASVRSNVPATQGIVAPKSVPLDYRHEEFSSELAGLLLFWPFIRNYAIDELIDASDYPGTSVISKRSAILSFLALKLSDIERYSMDDAWCMDRGMGLFAGLNILPKAAWFSSYSSSITREMNLSFLRQLHVLWCKHGLLSDTMNLDFTAIPYWGDDDPLENNWSGKRSKAMASMLAVLAQEPESGLLCYSDTTIRHRNQNDVVLEFLDFYHSDPKANAKIRYLVFDSRFTTYENLSKLNARGLCFITIQRRSKGLEEKISAVQQGRWKEIRIMRSNGKGRVVKASEDTTVLSGYDGELRQVFISRAGKEKPAVIITNDKSIPLDELVRKYARRWLVEKEISEQIHFFHLNRNSSGIVVKVDFDLVMTVLAHNLYKLFAADLEGYSHCEAKTLFTKFIQNAGQVVISDREIAVKLKRKRTLPLVMDMLFWHGELQYPAFHGRKLLLSAANTT